MTYWKLYSPLLLIKASFSTGTETNWRRDREKKTNFCSIQGRWVASCKVLRLPLGSVFPLDILSLMNCHSSHLRSHRGSWPLPWHTHKLSAANRLAPVVQHPSHSKNHSWHKSSSTGILVCVLPSLISDHTHLFTCDRQPLPLAAAEPPPTPHPLHRPETSVCCEANEQESWGNFRVDCWNRTRGPLLLYNRNLVLCSHEKHHSLSQRHAMLSYREHGLYFTCRLCFFF